MGVGVQFEILSFVFDFRESKRNFLLVVKKAKKCMCFFFEKKIETKVGGGGTKGLKKKNDGIEIIFHGLE